MRDFVIKCGSLIDGTGAPPLKDARILVKGERIARVDDTGGTGLEHIPYVIDASDKTVMPGLVDAHKHFLNSGGPTVALGLTPKQVVRNMRTTVMGGITSGLDLASGHPITVLKKLPTEKPRIFYSIAIVTCPGGYPAEYMPRVYYWLFGGVREAATDSQIRDVVRKLVRKGVSVIKTVSVTRTFAGTPQVNWTDHQFRTLCDEAHGWGLKVCAHVTYSQDYAQAIRCGVDSLHHAPWDAPLREEDIDAMIDKGLVFVPTLSLMDLFVAGFNERWCDAPEFDPPVNRAVKKAIRAFTDEWEQTPDDRPVAGTLLQMKKRELIRSVELQVDSLRRFVNKGGIVAMGTDASLGFSFHTTPIRELALLEECGMSTLEVIKASTLTAAGIFGQEHQLGSVETGKMADMLIIDGDPLTDIKAVGRLDTVILGGRIVRGNEPVRA